MFVQIALQDDKGDEDVRVFVKVNGNRILIGTLSVDKYPQCKIGLVFEKEFELMHTSKNSNISAIGFKFREGKRKYPFISHSSMFGKKLWNNVLFLNYLLYLCPHLIHTLVLTKVMLLLFYFWTSLIFFLITSHKLHGD